MMVMLVVPLEESSKEGVLPQPELEDRPDRVNFNLRVNRDEKGTASFFGQ